MIAETIIQIIKNSCAYEESVTFESDLKLLSLDSLTFVGIIVEIEDFFGIEFNVDEISISVWETVEDIVKNVEEKLNAKENN